ncbi:hypothetical protein PINS_up002825 [Pythium insidiosum]|nr:hypothetical protein PINS_up002825 [Pythium insidiosum]
MKVESTWSSESEARLEELAGREAANSFELRLQPSPWSLHRPSASENAANSPSCEIAIDVSSTPLQCDDLLLETVTSARHVEVYVKGIRRNLLGEEELSEVYFGTYRGSKPAVSSNAFAVSERFNRHMNDRDVLKCVHRIRLKFLSLTGDKSILEITRLSCQFTGAPRAPPADSAKTPTAAQATGTSDAGMPAGMLEMMASMSMASQGGLNPQALLLGVQQIMEREIETKIARALNDKLAMLSQRLSFSEQLLLQVRDRCEARDAKLEATLARLQEEVGDLQRRIPARNEATEET